MSGYNDISHITDIIVPGSAGPSVGWFEMIPQALHQQYVVDSPLSREEELRTRWSDSLHAMQQAGQSFNAPVDPLMYERYEGFVRDGTLVTTPTVEGQGYGARINYDVQQPHPEFEEMRRANEAIRQLNNPEIKTFEQIIAEVNEMQQGVEEETASMRERAPFGSFFAELIGGAAGSFTGRDPLNIVTMPIGAGRTIATKIGVDMLVAAGVTGVSEYGQVLPNRALAGLPERSLVFDVAAAAFGAGVFRGGWEAASYGLGRLGAVENIDFNARDSQLQAMFAANDISPGARAASSVLDDTIVMEHSNPYGEGQVAGFRWHAELEATARALNGEDEIQAKLPPMPSDYINRSLSFQTVRETRPDLWSKLEEAQARVTTLNTTIEQRVGLRDLGAQMEKRGGDDSNVTAFTGTYVEPEARAFHRDLTSEVKRRAQIAEDTGLEYHRSGQLPFKVGDRITTQKGKELGQNPWQVVGHFVDSKNPERYGYYVTRQGESSILLVSDPRADAQITKHDPNWNRADHVAGWEHVTDNPSEVVDFPMKETVQSKPGVNAGRLAKMLGPQLYGDIGNIGSVAIKEVLQNSFDAIKTALLRGLEKGKIDINTNKETREIEITDNGVGMTPQTLGTKFLEIAGTGKEEGASSGGFGIAKMLFLYGNDDLRVITMRDDRVSEMITTGKELFQALEDPTAAPKIEVRDPTAEDLAMFPDGSGTRVIMKIPKSYIDPKSGGEVMIDFPSNDWDVPSLGKSPLFADIDVKFNQWDVNIGSKFPVERYMPFSNIDFGWGTARVYVTRESEKMWGDNVHFLSNGIYQFSKKMTKKPLDPYSGALPYEFYIDISPKVSPEEPGYPFNFNRQSFTEKANKDLDKVLGYINALYAFDDLAKSADSFGNARYFDEETGQLGDPIDLKPEIKVENKFANRIKAGDEVFVRNGRIYINGKELPELKEEDLKEGLPSADELKVDPGLIEPDKIMVHDNMLVTNVNGEKVPFYDIMRLEFQEEFDDFLYAVGEVFRSLRDNVARVLDYPELRSEAIGLSFDPEYRGVSIRVPFSGSFINPFLPEAAHIIEAGYGTFGTMIHELAHFQVRSHNEKFPAEMQRIWYKLAANTDDYLELQDQIVGAMQKYEEVFRRGKEILEGKNVESSGKHLGGVNEDPNASGRDDRLFEGIDRSGEEGVGPGGIPEGPQQRAGLAQSGSEFGSDAFGPEADAALRAQLRIANQEYQKAYRAVEDEAERLEHAEAAQRSIAQAQAIDVFGPDITSAAMTGPLTRRDFVEAHAARVDEAEAAMPARADAVNELEVDLETNTVNIGTATPVSLDFKVPFDDGELSVRQVLDDLAEDQRLEEAVKGCAI